MKRILFALVGVAMAGCVSTTVEVAPTPVAAPDAGETPDAGSTPTATPDAATDVTAPATGQSYAVICVLSIASNEPAQAWRFAARVTRTGNSLDIFMTPIKGWNGTTLEHSKLSLSNTVGSAVSVTGIPVDAGRFTANFGTLSLPAEANSVSGRAAVIEGFTLAGVANGNMCASLSGQQTDPYDLKLNASENTCLLIPSNPADTFPSPAKSAFVCQ